MKEAIGTGETVEQAKEAACRQLGVETYEAEFEILEMPSKKTFGLFGGNPAKVRVFVEDNPAQIAADYLKKVIGFMGLSNVEVGVKTEEDGALLSLDGDDIGYVIGHRGETLDALQYLAGLVANHVGESYYRVTLDIGNYREKRRQTLETLGKKMAEKALRTGKNTSLEPMNPYERRIIHTAVQTVEGAKSWSEGEDLGRHVVIGPAAGERPQRKPYGNNHRGPGQGQGQGQGGHRPPFQKNRDFGGRPQQNGGRPGGYSGGRPAEPRPNQNRPASEGHFAQEHSAPAGRPDPAAPAQQADSVQQAGPKQESKGPLYGKVDFKKE